MNCEKEKEEEEEEQQQLLDEHICEEIEQLRKRQLCCNLACPFLEKEVPVCTNELYSFCEICQWSSNFCGECGGKLSPNGYCNTLASQDIGHLLID